MSEEQQTYYKLTVRFKNGSNAWIVIGQPIDMEMLTSAGFTSLESFCGKFKLLLSREELTYAMLEEVALKEDVETKNKVDTSGTMI